MRVGLKQKWKRYISMFILTLVIIDIIPINISMAMEHKANVSLGNIQHYNGIIFGNHMNGLKDKSQCTLGNFDKTHKHDEICLKGAEVEGAAAIKGNFEVNKSMDLGFAEKPGGPVVGEYDPNTGNPLLLLGGEYKPNAFEGVKPYSNHIVYNSSSSDNSKNLIKDLKLADEVGAPQVSSHEVQSSVINQKFEEFSNKATELINVGKGINQGAKAELTQGGENKVHDVTIDDVNSVNVIDQGANPTSFSIKKSKLKDKVLVADGLNKETLLFKDIYIPSEALTSELIVMYSEAKTVKFNSSGWMVNGKQIEISGASPNGDLVKNLAPKIVWILPNAENVYVAGCGVVGSVIAPNASVKGRGGSINGQTIAKNMLQLNGFELHNFHFVWDKVINTLKGGVEFTKVDSKTNAKLEGVKFVLRREDNSLVGRYTTDADGKIKVDGLDPGKYYFKEIATEEGYILLPDKLEFEIKPGDTNVIKLNGDGIVKNAKNKIEFKKVDVKNDSTLLEGAEFTLYEKLVSGNIGPVYGKPIVTGKDGKILLEGIPKGEYILRETKAPEGYNILVKDINITVTDSGEILVNGKKPTADDLTIENIKKDDPQIIFKKVKENKEPLGGAVFGIFFDGNNGINPDRLCTATDGHVEFKNLPVGTHIIKELEAPIGFELSNIEVKIQVDNKGNVTVLEGLDKDNNFVNKKIDEKLGSIKFTKVEKGIDPIKPLKGAEFSLYKVNQTEPSKVVITGDDGLVSFENLESGDYEIRETKAPEGYVPLETKVTFTITADGKLVNVKGLTLIEGTSVLENEKIPVLSDVIKMKKVDSVDTNLGLAGAEFELSGNGIRPIKLISNENGEFELPRLAPGEYTLKEMKSPNGYEPNEKVTINFTIDKDGKPSKDLDDKLVKNTKNKFSFTKIGENSEHLDGAIFEVLKDGIHLKNIESKDGIFKLEGLADGSYVIKEKVAPEGYFLNETEIKLNVKDGKIEVISGLIDGKFKNEKVYGAIEFRKVKTDNGDLSGATFTLSKTDDVNFKPIVVKEGPNFKFEKLVPGSYKIEETVVPVGYEKMNDIRFKVDNKGKLTDVIGLGNDNNGYVAKNREKVYNVSIHKTDEKTNALAGAEFKIYKGKGPIDNNSVALQTKVSDKNGNVEFIGLLAGDYIIKESKAPVGYEENNKEYPVKIEKNGEITFENGKNNLTVVNEKIYGQIEFTKVNTEGKEIKGAEFTLTKVKDTNFTPVVLNTGSVFKFEKLEPGDYKIEETVVPNEHEKMEDIRFTITKEGKLANVVGLNKTATGYEAINTKMYDVEITKNDEANKPLAEAEFKIFEGNGPITEEMVPLQTKISDASGKVKFTELKAGNYIIKESKAPVGYQQSLKEYAVKINNDGTIVFEGKKENLIVVNKKIVGEIEFNKIEVNKPGTILKGAKFYIYKDSITNKVGECIAAEGIVRFDNLVPGKYIIREIVAPTGYEVAAEDITFEVNENGKTINIEGLDGENFGNKPIDPEALGKFEFKKVDEKGNALTGAQFRLTKKGDAEFERLSDMSKSQIVFNNLKPGDYEVEETISPSGYKILKDKITFTIDKNGKAVNVQGLTEENTFINERIMMSGVTFKKVNEEGKPIHIAKFDINKKNNDKWELVKTVETNLQGVVTIEGLYPGTYQVVETEAPEGYEISGEKKEFTVKEDGTIDEDELKALGQNFVNIRIDIPTPEVTVGEFKFTKIDSESKNPLSGAEFTVYQGKEVIEKYVTGENGVVHIGGLLPGEYTIKETKAPDDYYQSKIEIKISVDKKGVVTVKDGLEGDKDNYVYKNTKLDLPTPEVTVGEFKFTKIDSESKNPLSGAEFTVYLNGEELGKFISGKDGIVHVAGLLPGEYTIKETKAPDDYYQSKIEIKISVDKKGVVTVKDGLDGDKDNYVYKNTKLDLPTPEVTVGEFKFTKIDSESKNPLSGAEFTVYQGKEVIAKYTTGKDGIVHIGGLMPGDYTVKETKVPDGYYQSNIEIKISVDKKGAVTVKDGLEGNKDNYVYKNTKLDLPTPEVTVGEFKFTKIDSESKNPLGGAEFTVYTNGEVLTKATTGDSGIIHIGGLLPGDYVIKETKAPAGYYQSNIEIKISVDKKGVVTVNDGLEGNKDNYVYNNTKLDLPTPEVIVGEFKFTKVDSESKEPLGGAEFTVYKDGEVLAKAITGDSGIIHIGGLLPGDYVIKETKAPNNYYQSNIEIKISVDKKGMVTVNGGLEGNKDNYVYNNTKLDLPTPEVTVGEFRFTKIDSESKDPLSGAEFTVYQGEEVIAKYMTGENGIVHIGGLLPGNYLIKETKVPEGYSPLGKEIKFTINKDGKQENVSGVADGKVENIKLSQPPIDPPTEILGKIEFIKVDSVDDSKLLKGAVFELFKSDGETSMNIIATSDEKGKVIFEKIPEGSYIIKEKIAPEGYEKSDVEIKFTVDGVTGKATVTEGLVDHKYGNDKLIDPTEALGRLEFVKVDSVDSNKKLEGAEFKLITPDGKEITIISDKDGKVILKDLKPGDYTVEETKAPNGYDLSKIKITFTIDENGKTVNIVGLVGNEFKNEKTPEKPNPTPDPDIEKPNPDPETEKPNPDVDTDGNESGTKPGSGNEDKPNIKPNGNNVAGNLPATGKLGLSIVLGLALVIVGSGVIYRSRK